MPPPWWVRHKRALAAAAAAQACAFLNAVTAVSSESISLQGVDVSTFQVRRFPRRSLALCFTGSSLRTLFGSHARAELP